MKRYATVDEVADLVQAIYGIKDDIRTTRGIVVRRTAQGRNVLNPNYQMYRLIAMHFCRWYTSTQFSKIAEKFDLKSRTSVIYADDVIRGIVEVKDPRYIHGILEIDRILSGSYERRPGMEEGKFPYHRHKAAISANSIIQMVTQEFNIKGDIRVERGVVKRVINGGKVHDPSYFTPRLIATHLCYKYSTLTKTEIAELFDLTSTSSVDYAMKRVNDMIDIKDKQYIDKIGKLIGECERLTMHG